MPLYKVTKGVSISGDLHGGDVFDSAEPRFANHDLPFLLARGDIEETTEEDRQERDKMVAAPGLAKRIADAQREASNVGGVPGAARIPEDEQVHPAEPGAGDRDVAIQQTRGDVLQPAETVPPTITPPDQAAIDTAAKAKAANDAKTASEANATADSDAKAAAAKAKL